jgi:uncharacterized membrane protein
MRWNLKRDAISLLSIVATAVLSFYFYASLPDRVPSHFAADGTPNGYSSKETLILVVLGSTVLLYLVLTFIPRIDPFWKKIQNRYNVLLLFRDIIMVFMLFIFTLTLFSARTGRLNTDLFGIGFGLLFILLGNYMPRLPRNFFFGVRTPWTLASEVVWRKTHIVSGWLFVAGGVLIILLSLLGVAMQVALLAVLLPIVLVSAFIYPYFLFHKLQREDRPHIPDL